MRNLVNSEWRTICFLRAKLRHPFYDENLFTCVGTDSSCLVIEVIGESCVPGENNDFKLFLYYQNTAFVGTTEKLLAE